MLDKISLTILFIGLVISGAIGLFITLVQDKKIELDVKSKRYLGAVLVLGLALVIIGCVMYGIVKLLST